MGQTNFEKDDSGIKVHERGVIAQLCSLFRSHEQGLPEWFKNASSAYSRSNTPTQNRVLTLFFGETRDGYEYIALLDHVGMSVEDLETRFAKWGDPEAHQADIDTEEIVEGGHGNGGKCYMTQMFSERSYLHTVRAGRGSRYGFVGDDPHPGYFPNKREGRGFPVARASDELRRVLNELSIDLVRLPEDVRTAAASDGFTLVVGIGPKHFRARDHARGLVEHVVHHPQMIITTKTNTIHVVQNGRPVPGMSPVVLPEIEPHEYAPEPRIIDIPDCLTDPVTGEDCNTRLRGSAAGRLTLRTSKKSMRRTLKGRHHITYLAQGRPRGFMTMEEVSRSAWVDRMYGDCVLDAVADYETPDRSQLADAPLTRALREWVKMQVLAYEAEFRQRDRLEASQEQRNLLSELNKVLDTWKNAFLDEMFYRGAGGGSGPGPRPRPRPRPLPAARPERVIVSAAYAKAGIGVWLPLRVQFEDAEGNRVHPPAYQWNSSDWAVATVDDNKVVTHTPGEVMVWVETVDGRLRSNHLVIQVLDTVTACVDPETIEVKAGGVKQLVAVVTDRDSNKHTDVFMTWLQDDSSVVSVTAAGRVIGRKEGKTNVYPVDERCVNDPRSCEVTVLAAEGVGDERGGKSYPKILLSEIDPDPLNPDGETVHLDPEDGPVHQPTPQHVEHNVWWINMKCPLARMYFGFGPESKEWRSYHVERIIEALVKIRLAMDFQVADEEIEFDEIERRWREVAAEVQKRAIEDLRPLLEGEGLEMSS